MGAPQNDYRLLYFLGHHAVTGVMAAAVVVYLIVKLDLFGLGTLLETSRDGGVALLLLFVGLGATFGGLAMATAVFMLPKDEDRWR
jgi:hypothetical protein